MEKINQISPYVLGMVPGILLGAFGNFYFYNNLQMAGYIKNLIWLTVIAGVLGGTVNYLLNQTEEFKSFDCLKNIFFGLVAAALVPLFLNMLSSDLIRLIRGDEKDAKDPYQYFVFFGFCLIAAVSSRAFIQTISDRVLNLAKEANRKAENAVEKAADAQKKSKEIKESLEPLIDTQGDPEPEPTVSESFVAEDSLGENELKVLRLMNQDGKAYRSKGGIMEDTNVLNGEEVENILSELVRKSLIKTFIKESGSKRWFITEAGRSVLRQSR